MKKFPSSGIGTSGELSPNTGVDAMTVCPTVSTFTGSPFISKICLGVTAAGIIIHAMRYTNTHGHK